MQTVFKSSVNPDHVEALKKLMRENVGRLDMSYYLFTDSGYVDTAIVLEELKNPTCQTTACIAGFAALQNPEFHKALDYETGALEYLGIKESLAPRHPFFDIVPADEYCPWLFHLCLWPDDLNRRYEAALEWDEPAEAVEVACEAIDRYIAEYQKAELAAAKGGAL